MKWFVFAFRNIGFVIALFLQSCITGLKDDHPGYFERFFTQLDTASFRTYPAALDSLDFAIHHFPAGVGDKSRYYRVKADYYQRKADYGQTFNYLDSLETTIRGRVNEQRFLNLQWQLLIIRSECYSALKSYDAAMKCLMETKTLGPGGKYTEDCDAFLLDSRIADMLYRQGRFLKAAEYYRLTFEREKKCFNNKEAVFQNGQRYLDNIGLCYLEAGMPDSALFYFNATLDFLKIKEKEFPHRMDFIKLARGVVYGNIARIKALRNDYEAAEALSLSSIEATEKDDKGFTLNTNLQLANIYIAWNKPREARQVLDKLGFQYGFRKPGPLAEQRMAWNLAMRKSLSKEGDLLTAYGHTAEYLRIRDSLDLSMRKDISRDLGQEFENLEQKSINDQLEAVNREKSFQLVISVLVAALAVVIAFFVWQSLWRSSKHVAALKTLNAQVQEKNDDLMQAFSSLEASQAENTRMTRMVAHDLKNPISGIRTLVYTLQKKEEDKEVQKILELIYSTCANSLNLIDNLLKQNSGLSEVKKEMVDLRRLMEYCVDLLQTKSEEKKQSLHFKSDDPVYVYADGEKMWRVISNLLSNAIKFSPEYSTINISLERKADTALLSVKDEGIGIPESLRNKIFASDPDASRRGTWGEESHGLGLAISHQIVTEHNGRIWFESEEKKGSTFYVELPVYN